MEVSRSAAVMAMFLVGGPQAAVAQPAGGSVVHGQAGFQQNGSSLTVTTVNGAGTRHSVIDWRSFSVPGGSITSFVQPGADSTSINRVTGSSPSQILGTLSSNGKLVLVNPSGIAVGAGAMVDSAGFTASTLQLSDADAIAGRLRFSASPAGGPLSVDGRVLARSGDVVLLGTDVSVGANALLQAPAGAVIVAAGQRVELTGRGLEGIVFELVAPTDRVVNLGRLEGDAVGLFAGQLTHTGYIQSNTVTVLQDKLHLGRLLQDGKDKDKEKDKDDNKDKDGNGNGNSGNGNGNGNGGTAANNSGGSTNSGGNGNSRTSSGTRQGPGSTATSASQRAAVQTVQATVVDYQPIALKASLSLASQPATTTAARRSDSADEAAANTSTMGAPAACLR